MAAAIRVLHVDDDPTLGETTARYLEAENDQFVIETATNADEALDRLPGGIDCVVSDYEMRGTNGIELLEAVREEHPDLPFVLFTGKGSEAIASVVSHALLTRCGPPSRTSNSPARSATASSSPRSLAPTSGCAR